MSYVVFARKYRPQVFDDVIGQSHVTTTLKNAITQDRVAHAYLFAGPRGVGKTTTARLLAKALNCEKGPTVTPCNSCASCKEISTGSGLDILEIDGASNRGIDEIRNLRDNVKFAPSKGKFKVYIIDEVHMLTPEAFNALLKTLEEPPAHVKFIFATTQAYKVPPTIISRCQRFDFRRMAASDIITNLKNIVKSEKLNASDDALALIARYSDGAMRDAQVLLDQLISFTRDSIGVEDVTKMLGLVSDDILFKLAGYIKDKDAPSALKMVDSFFNDGKDVFQIVLGLITHFRNVAVTKISKDAGSILDCTKDKLERYKALAERFTIEEILYAIYTLSNTIDFIRKSGLSRVPLEAAVIKLSRAGSIASLESILDKVEGLVKSAPVTDRSAERH
ncbi:MAG: DNA polymerase III subunit gamma/tau, partial [Candidatus Omnitrophota bacterium]